MSALALSTLHFILQAPTAQGASPPRETNQSHQDLLGSIQIDSEAD